jgi:NAD(P)-dependent dehydrogenase (short-subunit alcohol dehydrogenase family)
MSVLICGAAGIGRALALRLHAKGVPIHLLARDAAKLAALSASAGGAPFTVADAAADSFEGAVRDIAASTPLRGLVYAIGSIPLKPLKGTAAADFLSAFTVNALSAALALKAAAPSLGAGAQPGSVVLFSTVACAQGFPNHAAISMAKGAVEALTRSAASELAPRVRVNCIAPSLTDTPLAARMLSSDAMRKALGEAHPIPRVGAPDDVAALAELLLEPTSFINGQVLAVDGGRSTLRPKN